MVKQMEKTLTEKIDVLELLISIIQEHEKKLDEITSKLEIISKVMEKAAASKKDAENESMIKFYAPIGGF